MSDTKLKVLMESMGQRGVTSAVEVTYDNAFILGMKAAQVGVMPPEAAPDRMKYGWKFQVGRIMSEGGSV